MELRSIDEVRPVKVIVIGAGVSGIIAGIRFPQRIPNLDLVIYDKNPDIGGTWFENRYPGIACGRLSATFILSVLTQPCCRHSGTLVSIDLRAQPEMA